MRGRPGPFDRHPEEQPQRLSMPASQRRRRHAMCHALRLSRLRQRASRHASVEYDPPGIPALSAGLRSWDNVTTVRRLVAFYVQEHNTVLPHSAFRGQTPDEMYFGNGDAVPADLRARAAAARQARIQANRSAARGSDRPSTRPHEHRPATSDPGARVSWGEQRWLMPSGVLYEAQDPTEQRRLLETVLSNCTFDRGNLCPTYNKPFDLFVRANETGEWRGRRDSNPRPLP